jgi:predicted homoserine dehydrogenase-like protein
LPIGIAEGCILRNNIPKDQVITYDDVIVPEGRLVDRLRKEQEEYFKLEKSRINLSPWNLKAETITN